MQPRAERAAAPLRRRTHGSGSRRSRPRPADARRWASPFFGVLLAGSMAASSHGPPLRERGLLTSSASGRPSMPGFANPPPPNPNPPRFRRRPLRRLRASIFPGPIGPFGLGGAEAAKRRMRPRPAANRLDAPERVRRGLLARGAGARERPGLAMPMGDGGALSIRALEWGDESGRTRKGRRPAPTPLNETHFLSYKPFPSYGPGKQKEGPAVSGGPLGYPWWSLGGSNP